VFRPRATRAARSLAIALLAIAGVTAFAGGCDPLHPQAFFAAPWNDEEDCLDGNAAVDVYDDEAEPVCSADASCVAGPENDGRLYVTTCPIPIGWTPVDAAADPRCTVALDAFALGKDGRCE